MVAHKLTFHETGTEYIIVTKGEFLRGEGSYPHVHLTRAVSNKVIDTVGSVDRKGVGSARMHNYDIVNMHKGTPRSNTLAQYLIARCIEVCKISIVNLSAKYP